ncbi:MAG: hypothetical protein ACR2MF_06415 [Chthoniobacterales bacterium]
MFFRGGGFHGQPIARARTTTSAGSVAYVITITTLLVAVGPFSGSCIAGSVNNVDG